MKIIDMLSTTWAIIPEHLTNITTIINAHIRGPKLDLAGIEAKLQALEVTPAQKPSAVGVRIIPIVGVISKRPSAFERIFFDGVSSEQVKADFLEAVNDPTVNIIILYIDSPGGTVDGTTELANAIYEQRGKKPIIAYSDGMIASAAYTIGSAADKIYISSESVMAGSVGVVAVHADYSEQNKMIGVNVTEIFAGKYKRIASMEKPLSEEGQAYIQAQVDYHFSNMVNTISRNRGISVEDALSKFANGKIFIGQQAIDAGLVDGISSSPLEIENTSSVSGGAVASESKSCEVNMDINELREKFSDIYKAVLAEGKAAMTAEIGDVEAAKKDSFNAGAKYERERIQAVKGKNLSGHEALIETLMFDGKTTGEQAADAVLKAEQVVREKRLAEFQKDNPAVSHANAPEEKLVVDKNKPVEERAKAEWDKSADLRAEFAENYESYLAYKKADEKGCVKILKGGN
jgi:capsid assembly protease